MLDINNSSVRKLLLSGNFGLEKEGLRITTDGEISHTPHPFAGNKNIVRDFSENQTEINTGVNSCAEDAISELSEYTGLIYRTLADLPESELIWPFSNPPFIKNEDDIPIAQFYGEERSKTEYREHLAGRYGKYKMMFSGIHVNYSFSDELLKAAFGDCNENEFQEKKNELYLMLAEKLALYGWIVTAITAASPIMDTSFIDKGLGGNSAYLGMGSVRCSELGYWNHFVPVFDYSGIKPYVDSIRKYVDDGWIVSASELYYPVRIKPIGINTLERLEQYGVNHIELRMIDLNPFEYSGLALEDLKFIQLLIVCLASTPKHSITTKDQVQAVQNFKYAARFDLKTVPLVIPGGTVMPVADAALGVLSKMEDFYSELGNSEAIEIIKFQKEKFLDQGKRYSWMVREQYGSDFLSKGLELAEKYRDESFKTPK